MQPLHHLRSWLRAEGMWWDPAHHTDLTHVFLDGGKASVPHERREEFWQAYARCLSRQPGPRAKPLALRVVERIDPARFHMFFDVDVGSMERKAAQDIVMDALVPTASSLLEASHAVVCGKPDVAATDIKPGFHVVWPGLVVDRETAACVVSECIARLPEHAAWLKTALDTSVYGGSGLRMVFSQKKPDDPAADVYVPVREWRDGTWTEVCPAIPGPVHWLRACTLRPPPAASVAGDSQSPAAFARDSIEESSSSCWGGDFVPPTQYQPCRITAVRTNGSSNGRIIHTTSRFCANIGRCHKSNHVYFIVSARGTAYQLCHDPDCKGFRCLVANGECPPQQPLQQHMPTAGEVVMRQLQALLGGNI